MEKNVINATLSTESLTFRSGSSPVSFEVTVNNDSDQFANFQLQISAPGENQSPGYSWYKLSPEVAAAQPHGSSTQFQVSIVDTPIPGFVGIVNLTVTIFSPQLRQQRRLLLRLKIEPEGGPTLLGVELPVRDFQVYPCNRVDILVRVRNWSQQPVNVTLHFTGIDPSWLPGGPERRLLVNPGGQSEAKFQCQPPSVLQAPSLGYSFKIEARGNNSVPASAQGSLEVLPIGFLEFFTTQNQQKIPPKGRWLPNWKSNSAIYELGFKNVSNLTQRVNVLLQGRDSQKCTYMVDRPDADLNIGETTKVFLEVKTKKRPWVGIGKTLLFEAKSELLDQRLGTTDPSTQALELKLLPIVPLWLQLAILALLAVLLAFLLSPTSVSHTALVQSVRLDGTVSFVISASDDCTLRRWRIDANSLIARLEPQGEYTDSPLACGTTQQPKGLLAIPDTPIQALRFMPRNNEQVAAGLQNGVIQIWDVPNRKKIKELNPTGDKVFDLLYTRDSRYLFSGHGSGNVRLWSAPLANGDFKKNPEFIDLQERQKLRKFGVRALSLSPDEKTLVIAGEFKRFILWRRSNDSWSTKQPILERQKLEKFGSAGENDYVLGLAFAPSKEKEILATSDSDGRIAIWNLKKPDFSKNVPSDTIIDLDNQPIDSWSAGQNAVNSLAFKEDGSLLVSGGDDGRVMAWFLTPDYKLDQAKKPTVIYQSSKQINSIDVKTSKEGTMIVSGGYDFQVNLNRF